MGALDTFKVKESFKNRTIGFWIWLIAGCLLLGAAIALMILYYTGNVFFHPDDRDKVRMVWVFVFFFAGAALHVVSLFTDLKFAPLCPIILYSLGIGMYLYLAMFPIADAVTGVAFFGGSLVATVTFVILFLIGAIAAVASCFMDQRKVIVSKV